MRDGFKEYLRHLEAEEWPAMTAGRATPRASPPGVADVLAALLSFAPGRPGEQFAQERAVVAVERALEARQNRIMLSGVVISPVQWAEILTLDVLVLLTIAMVHIDRRVTVAVNLFAFPPRWRRAWCCSWSTTGPSPPAAPRSSPARCGRSAPASPDERPPLDSGMPERTRAELQRQPQHDIEAQGRLAMMAIAKRA